MDSKQIAATSTQLDLHLNSAALKRLTDEVAMGTTSMIRGYNRTHNRHNR